MTHIGHVAARGLRHKSGVLRYNFPKECVIVDNDIEFGKYTRLLRA